MNETMMTRALGVEIGEKFYLVDNNNTYKTCIIGAGGFQAVEEDGTYSNVDNDMILSIMMGDYRVVKEHFAPDNDNEFFYCGNSGQVIKHTWNNEDTFCQILKRIGNCYPDEDTANKNSHIWTDNFTHKVWEITAVN